MTRLTLSFAATLLALSVAAPAAHALTAAELQGTLPGGDTYIDIDNINTPIAATNWGWPDTSDSGLTVNGNVADDKGNSPVQMTTTVGGLTPGAVYRVDVVAFGKVGTENTFGFAGGLNSGSLKDYTLVQGQNIAPGGGDGPYRVLVGRGIADGAGNLNIFTDNESTNSVRSEIDGVILRDVSMSNVFNLDFDRGTAGTQIGFDSITSTSGDDNSAFNETMTFANVFGAGQDVTLQITGNRRKDRDEITSGPGQPLADLLEDWWGSDQGGDTNLSLLMPAGVYQIETFHHDASNGGDQAFQMIVTDAAGVRILDGVETAGTSPTSIGSLQFSIVSDGFSAVTLSIPFANAGTQIGINGLTLTAANGVPEPASLALMGLAGMTLLRRRRPDKPLAA